MSEKKKRPAALCSPLCKEEFNQPFDAFSRLLVLSISFGLYIMLNGPRGVSANLQNSSWSQKSRLNF